ncbi:hypothetical protein DPMN_132214 [Dreissena polymorpha]|uniref:Uncharacterized protein n=1 Tax=Dreissena polymorpha TaxID=45954 RepID=A0A9D4FXW7_DREPO|nr:hypothetical protein DPMN_132214 [Dreissena polymorpha]
MLLSGRPGIGGGQSLVITSGQLKANGGMTSEKKTRSHRFAFVVIFLYRGSVRVC